MLKIGKAIRAHGIRGDVKIFYGLDQVELKSIKAMVINSKKYQVEKINFGNGCAYVKFKGVNDRDVADVLRGDIFVDDENRPTLPSGTYYIDDLVGLYVVVGDVKVGVLREILQYGAADVYCVDGIDGNKNFMFPHKIGVIEKYDLPKKCIVLSEEELMKVAIYEN